MTKVRNHSVWQNQEVKRRLDRYYEIMKNSKSAKFIIAKHIPYEGDLKSKSIKELWIDHYNLSSNFKKMVVKADDKKQKLEDLEKPKISFLDLKVELLYRMLRECEYCEWRCRIDRVDGKRKGACKVDSNSKVSTWFHHYGEEAPLVTGRGSGTIFFTGCTFRCVFCQNWDISQNSDEGTLVDGNKLSLIMKSLRTEGVANINFVGGDPTPNLHTIIEGINQLEVNTPLLWNSNMYLTSEATKILVDVIDIWLPDFKWRNNSCALKYSKVPRYFEVISRNHKVAQNYGDMIIRHLVIPGHIDCCTKPILKWIAENCPRALVNIMGQYHPDYLVQSSNNYQDIDRFPSSQEMDEAYKYADKLGVIYQPVL